MASAITVRSRGSDKLATTARAAGRLRDAVTSLSEPRDLSLCPRPPALWRAVISQITPQRSVWAKLQALVWRWGEREIVYLSPHCHHQNDFCIKMGSDESHFNVSVGSDGQSHRTVSTNHNLFEEKGEPKPYRTEVLPLTSLTPYH